MQRLDGRNIYSATDLNNYVECRHLVALEREVAAGLSMRPLADDPAAELIARKGIEHEERRLAAYVATVGDAVVQFGERPVNSLAGLAQAEARTLAAMTAGAQIIYQATFFDGHFVGHADFLRRVPRASAHWAWSYEVLDTKLALSPKPYFLIQLCNYSEHLERLQGTAPGRGYVVFGNGEEREFSLASYAAYYRHLKASFLRDEGFPEATYPLEVAHCNVCAWSPQCERRREADDHPSLVAGIRSAQIVKFETAGVATMTALALAPTRPAGMIDATFENLQVQATLQVEQREAAARGDAYPYRYRFRKPAPAATAAAGSEGSVAAVGFAKLPSPAPGDVFFDIEGDPLYRAERGLEYLFGLYLPDEDRYRAFWAKDASEERSAFEACVDFIAARLERYPDLHVYHYASYERSALGRLMGEFASREHEIDTFFTIGLFVDLYEVVRQALWISQPSYSLKKVEALYGWARATETRGGADSVVMFERWLATREDALLVDIERYNEDDCRSTHALHAWLLRLREEFNAQRAEQIPWRAARTAAPPKKNDERTELERALLDGIVRPASRADVRILPDDIRERWLLGNLLQYHRRENKPQYWDYHWRCENVDELIEFDRKALGGLTRVAEFEPQRLGKDRHFVYAYTYPLQEHDLSGKPHCPKQKKPITAIVSHDEDRRLLYLKMSDVMAGSLRALIPESPLSHAKRQGGIERIAHALLEGRLEREQPATVAILRAAMPRLRRLLPGQRLQPATVDAASLTDAITRLDGSYLVVQGPPGSGKSTLGAAAVVAMLRAGRRVGLMANSHKALHGLLDKIECAARAANLSFTGVHKASTSTENSTYESELATPLVKSVTDAKEILDADLVSGTAHFWPEAKVARPFDLMVIDEAGQVSLADALNAAAVASNVVLLGDPRQLPQVTQGSHPAGVGTSVLEHLLGERDTVAPDRGIFLDVSYRMQPSLARFVSATSYEHRLAADSGTCVNRIDTPGLSGGGLAYLPVEHEGNGRYSIEEAARIVEEVRALLLGTYVRGENPPSPHPQPRPLTARDILVVTPYNLQRQRIQRELAAAGFACVAVGTVDKFQGQEAPVVFYSMATSSDEDLPRDMAFLFDRNRFNVAISRAQCLSVLVCSPRLLDARCRSPEQMQLVSLLCGFVEAAPQREEAPLVAP